MESTINVPQNIARVVPAPAPTSAGGNDRPIFIVGCARSGTTLLELMLHAHPRIAMPPETRFLMKLYDKRVKLGDLGDPQCRAAVASAIVDRKDSKFRDLRLDREKVRQAIMDGPPTLGSAVGIVFREYAARHGKPRWGDKRPNYINYINPLLALFPDAQIVHIIRDGRDCVASLKRMLWWKHPFRVSVNKWIQAIEAGNAARQKLRPDQYYELKYEHLVANPEKELRALCQYLGEAFHPAMLEPHKIAPIAVPERKLADHHQQLTAQEISTKTVGNWLRELTPKELALMETMAEKQLRQYGYALSGRGGEISRKRHQRVVKLIEEVALKASQYEKTDAQRTQRYGRPVQALLTRGQVEIYKKNIPPIR